MMVGLEIALCAAALVLLIPVMMLASELLFALQYDGNPRVESGERRRLAVLMPAHNEASIIASTLRSVIPQLSANDRLLVVADNCADDTADIAMAEGAEVVFRSDPIRRGKGYALDYGVRHLGGHGQDPPDIVIIIDADCQVGDNAIDRLARSCARTARPIQAMYLMHAAKDAGMKMRVAEFAWAIKNKVRPLGLHRLGLPCQLMGTGMAFPWACISTANLASGHIVEDLQLGVDLALAGSAPLFCPEAFVSSNFPTSEQGIASQRLRWEHGYLGVLLTEFSRLLALSFRTLNGTLFVFALDLSVPPIALLILLLTAMWGAGVALCVIAHIRLPLIVCTLEVCVLVLAIGLAWRKFGRSILSLGDLTRASGYVLWKIPLYIKFLVHRQTEWVRSQRDKDRH